MTIPHQRLAANEKGKGHLTTVVVAHDILLSIRNVIDKRLFAFVEMVRRHMLAEFEQTVAHA